MGQRSERLGLDVAWRALAGGGAAGWRTIPVGTFGGVRVLAGRQLPGNEEALLLGFGGRQLPATAQMPQGRGFGIARVELELESASGHWAAVTRQPGGSLQLFALMVTDLVDTMDALPSGLDAVNSLLTRVRAWQDFMQRGNEGVLGPEAEVGLVGELHCLLSLIEAGVDAGAAVDSWQGPINGLHDFVLGSGAIEAKASAATAGFIARIGSLEQLDDTSAQPLVLAALRLALSAEGKTLSELVAEVREVASTSTRAHALLDSRLLHAGYLEARSDRYTRRFKLADQRMIRVGSGFPRLTSSSVPSAIRSARYELDLDGFDAEVLPIEQVLNEMGVI